MTSTSTSAPTPSSDGSFASATLRCTVKPYAALRTRPITSPPRWTASPPYSVRYSSPPTRSVRSIVGGSRSSSGHLSFATAKPRPESNGVSDAVRSVPK